ncbi:MAG: hypothetical protein M4579_003697 [Chaenotheca gracillima]|nr:MAG: hypothetical protein M4579_003697 [Chaenotheca gracillima]
MTASTTFIPPTSNNSSPALKKPSHRRTPAGSSVSGFLVGSQSQAPVAPLANDSAAALAALSDAYITPSKPPKPPKAAPSQPSSRGLVSLKALSRERRTNSSVSTVSPPRSSTSSLRSVPSSRSLSQETTATSGSSRPSYDARYRGRQFEQPELPRLPPISGDSGDRPRKSSRSSRDPSPSRTVRHVAEPEFRSSSPTVALPGSSKTANGRLAVDANMHQTSSRLLRMTDDDRPFTKDFTDLFSTLMVSLPLNAHRVRFQKVDHTFTSEEAINNLGSLKFSQSNRMPDPKDPARIVTTTTTTTFSMAREMARSVCQRFMDARFVESADGKPVNPFPLKNAVWQLTPKGMHVLQRFCQRNGIVQRHVLEVLDSPRNTMQLVILERDVITDKLSRDRSTIEVLFRRFVGQDGPNTKQSTSSADSDSLSDYSNGLIGVKMAKERRIFEKAVHNTFTGKAAVDWLMDCCTTVDRTETREIAAMFVHEALIYPIVDDQVHIKAHPTESDFQPTKQAIYGLTNKGQRIAGWISREKGAGSDGENGTRSNHDNRNGARDSNTNRLQVILSDNALRLLFREYLRDTHCEENLSFYLDVMEFLHGYRITVRSNSAPKVDTIRETLAAAYGLYNAFLAPGSPCELNIDHNLRNNLAARMTRAVGDDQSMVDSLTDVAKLFDEAQNSVSKLMASDSVPKFLKDPRYAPILRERDFDRTVATHQQQSMTALPERTLSKISR